MFGLNLQKSGVTECWIFSIFTLTHTKVKVKKSENAVSFQASFLSICRWPCFCLRRCLSFFIKLHFCTELRDSCLIIDTACQQLLHHSV